MRVAQGIKPRTCARLAACDEVAVICPIAASCIAERAMLTGRICVAKVRNCSEDEKRDFCGTLDWSEVMSQGGGRSDLLFGCAESPHKGYA